MHFWSPDFPLWDPKLLEEEEKEVVLVEEEENSAAVEMSDISAVPLVETGR